MRDASPGTLKIVYDVTDHIARRLPQFPNVRLFIFARSGTSPTISANMPT